MEESEFREFKSMRISTSPAKRSARRGFTIVEFVVSLVIISLLAALIIPEIQHSRTPARRTVCQSNLRTIGLAVQYYATTHRSAVPPLAGGVLLKPSQSGKELRTQDAPWSVHLLPYLEQQALYDRLQVGLFDQSGDLASIAIETFVCPDDPKSDEGGNQSYVANTGMMAIDLWNSVNDREHAAEGYDFGFNGYSTPPTDLDRQVAYSTGVFWRLRSPAPEGSPHAPTLDFISKHDGTSQTVLLSENCDTRPRDPAANTGGWYSDATIDMAFGIPVDGRRVDSRFEVALGDQSMGVGTAGDESNALSLGKPSVRPDAGINSSRGKGRPRPTSNHPGVVNMAFADGSCKVISEKISLDVYARLLSPAGNRHGQLTLSSSEF